VRILHAEIQLAPVDHRRICASDFHDDFRGGQTESN
jgi:hypothetical protein